MAAEKTEIAITEELRSLITDQRESVHRNTGLTVEEILKRGSFPVDSDAFHAQVEQCRRQHPEEGNYAVMARAAYRCLTVNKGPESGQKETSYAGGEPHRVDPMIRHVSDALYELKIIARETRDIRRAATWAYILIGSAAAWYLGQQLGPVIARLLT
jgi:hypothetical protein